MIYLKGAYDCFTKTADNYTWLNCPDLPVCVDCAVCADKSNMLLPLKSYICAKCMGSCGGCYRWTGYFAKVDMFIFQTCVEVNLSNKRTGSVMYYVPANRWIFANCTGCDPVVGCNYNHYFAHGWNEEEAINAFFCCNISCGSVCADSCPHWRGCWHIIPMGVAL